MRVTIVGFGLIGGSIARALRRVPSSPGEWHVTVVNRSPDDPARALAEGVVDAVAPDLTAGVGAAELVVLAASATANLELLDAVATSLAGRNEETTVSDVSSTKQAITERAARHRHLHFVGGHPMSGREQAGYASSTADLFAGRPWVVTPGPWAGADDVARVERLVRACGARPVHLDPEQHDSAVAAVSHLPLIAAAALVEAVAEAPDWALARELAAQGWRDLTRLARGDAAMGGALLATNRAAVAERLRRYVSALQAWLEDVEAADEAALVKRLAASRDGLSGPR